MNVGRWETDAARWLGRWLVVTAAVYAAWVVVTLAQGGMLVDGISCYGSPNADILVTGAMSAAVALPLAAAWSAARRWRSLDAAQRNRAWNVITILGIVPVVVYFLALTMTLGCQNGGGHPLVLVTPSP